MRDLAGDPLLQPLVSGVTIEPFPAHRRAGLGTAPLAQPRIALFGSAGSPYHHLDIFATSGFDVEPVGSQAIRDGVLARFDVFVMPGGGWEFMEGQLGRLGTDGADRIREFVMKGGCYLSSCAGTHCVLDLPVAAAADWHPASQHMPRLSAESWLKGDRDTHHVKSPGIGVIRTRLPDPAHPVCAGVPDGLACVYYNGPILRKTGSGFRSLLDCAGPEPDLFTPGEALLGGDSVDLDGTAMADAGRQGYSAGGVEEIGDGRIVAFGLHPEFGSEPTMLEWGKPARLLANAAEWCARPLDNRAGAPAGTDPGRRAAAGTHPPMCFAAVPGPCCRKSQTDSNHCRTPTRRRLADGLIRRPRDRCSASGRTTSGGCALPAAPILPVPWPTAWRSGPKRSPGPDS